MKKHTKQHLHSLLQMPGYVFWKDTNSRFLGCNEAFARFCGKSPEEIIGKRDEDLGLDPSGTLCSRLLMWDHEVMQKKKRVQFREDILDGTGSVHHIIANERPLFDEKGKIVGIIGVFLDD